MNVGLIRKELRGQWPFLFLGIALLVLEVIENFREQWDLRPLSITFHNFGQFLVAQFVIAFAVGTAPMGVSVAAAFPSIRSSIHFRTRAFSP